MSMLSYHNDANLKALVVSEMKKHQEQDQFIKGTYGKGEPDGQFKGCSVGCTIDSINRILGKSYLVSDHNAVQEALDIPKWLALLQDTLFEGLPDGEGAQFSVDFLSAIPVGVNLEPVKYKFCAFVLKDCVDIVTKLPDLDEAIRKQVLKPITDVLVLHETAIQTDVWDQGAAWAAAETAWVGAEAAWVAESAATGAAWAAAETAWVGAEAAWVAESAATGAARDAAYKRYAVELIRLLGDEK